MGRYVGNKWHEELPSSGAADQQQGNSVPVSASPSASTPQSTSAPAATPTGAGGASNYGTPGYWTTVNGQRTTQQMADELATAGYNGPTDPGSIIQAYQRTTGGPVTSGLGFSGAQPSGDPGSAGNPASVAANPSGNANLEFFNQQAEALKNSAAATAAQIAYQYARMNQVEVPGLQIQRDQLAFQQAQDAALQAYRTADLDLRKLTEQHQNEIATGQLDLAKLTEQHKEELDWSQFGLDTMKLVAGLQADPFRQQEVINGLSQNGNYSRAIDAATGNATQPTFQAPMGSAADSRTLGALAGRITGAGTVGQAQAPQLAPAPPAPSVNSGAPAATTGALFNAPNPADGAASQNGNSLSPDSLAYKASLAALPDSPTQIVARNFNNMDKATQQFILSGESAKNGLSMDTNNELIQKTLPKFSAPLGSVAA